MPPEERQCFQSEETRAYYENTTIQLRYFKITPDAYFTSRHDEPKLDFLNTKTIKISSFNDETSFERGFARRIIFIPKRN